VRPVRVLKASDRLGLVYSKPFPWILTADLSPPFAGGFMAVVLPIEAEPYLPHAARVSIAVQKKYAAQITGLAVFREFYAGSREAYEALDAAVAKVASVETENLLDLAAEKKSIEQVKNELEEPVEQTDAGCADMITRATITKGTLEVERIE